MKRKKIKYPPPSFKDEEKGWGGGSFRCGAMLPSAGLGERRESKASSDLGDLTDRSSQTQCSYDKIRVSLLSRITVLCNSLSI